MHGKLTLAAALSLAIAASSHAASPPVGAPVKTIDLYSYGYSPKPIRLAAGRAVTLHFVNRSGKGHDFTAREFFAASRILSGRVRNGEVDLAGGRSASVTLIPARGTYKVHCGHFMHKQLGMRGRIIVD